MVFCLELHEETVFKFMNYKLTNSNNTEQDKYTKKSPLSTTT